VLLSAVIGSCFAIELYEAESVGQATKTQVKHVLGKRGQRIAGLVIREGRVQHVSGPIM